MVRRRRAESDRLLIGRIGAFRLHAMYDPRQTTQNARKAFLDSFERQVDPHGLLPIDERRRRAAYAKKAHFARLARLSARQTRKPKQTQSHQPMPPFHYSGFRKICDVSFHLRSLRFVLAL